MLKYSFIVFFVFILFLGCKSPKIDVIIDHKNNEGQIEVNIEDYEYRYDVDKTTILGRLHDYSYYNNYNYREVEKTFSVRYKEDLLFLQNFSQDELSDYIELLIILSGSSSIAIPYITVINNLRYLDWESWDFKNISTIEDFIFGTDTDIVGKAFTVKYEEELIFLQSFSEGDLLDYIERLDFRLNSEIVALPYITNLSNIRYLSLYSVTKNISAIANYKNLESLIIFIGHDFEDIEGMDAIFDLPNLKELMIYGPYYGSKTDLIELTHIGKLEKLEYLFITGCYVDQDGLNNLDNLMQLEELYIGLINIVDFSPLLSLPNLERLTISSVHNYYDIVLPLATSKSLKTINFVFNCSDEEYYKFMENDRRIFSENGIYIHWMDRR